MVNKVMLLGNLGRDPEIRTTQAGHKVAQFSVATNRRWNDRDGNRHEETDWHDIVCWGRLAEVAEEFLHKGKKVFVEGRLQTRSWEDQATGQKRYRTEVVCLNFQMLGSNGNGGPPPEAPPEIEAAAPAPENGNAGEQDSDIPF